MHINEVYEKITKMAWEDEAFKQKLLKDPKAAVKEAIGFDVPEGVKLTVIESKPDDLHFVLPMAAKKTAELSDSDLDQVAGGKGDTTYNGNGNVVTDVTTNITISF